MAWSARYVTRSRRYLEVAAARWKAPGWSGGWMVWVGRHGKNEEALVDHPPGLLLVNGIPG